MTQLKAVCSTHPHGTNYNYSVNSQLWKVWVSHPENNLLFPSPWAGRIWKHFWWPLRCFVSPSVLLWGAILILVLTVPQQRRKKHLKSQLEKGGGFPAFSWGKGRGKGSKTGKRHKEHLALALVKFLHGGKTESWFEGIKSKKAQIPSWITGSKATLIPPQSPPGFPGWLS